MRVPTKTPTTTKKKKAAAAKTKTRPAQSSSASARLAARVAKLRAQIDGMNALIKSRGAHKCGGVSLYAHKDGRCAVPQPAGVQSGDNFLIVRWQGGVWQNLDVVAKLPRGFKPAIMCLGVTAEVVAR